MRVPVNIAAAETHYPELWEWRTLPEGGLEKC